MRRSWADGPVTRLLRGESAEFRPRGSSMHPRVKDGQLVRVSPRPHEGIKAGDVVLCRVNGRDYLHLVKATREDAGGVRVFQIGNMRGHINGWTSRVYGVMEE